MNIRVIMGNEAMNNAREVTILDFVYGDDACAVIVDEDNSIRTVSLTYTNGEPVFKLKEASSPEVRAVNTPAVREKLKGKTLTKREMLEAFGYSPTTSMCDTKMYRQRLIEKVEGSWPRLWKVL